MSHRSLREIVKLCLAVCAGFMLRIAVDVPDLSAECPACPKCPVPVPQAKEFVKTHHVPLPPQLQESFIPKSMYEVIRFDYLNASYIYNNFDDDPRIGLLGHQKADLKDISQQVMGLFNDAQHSQAEWKMDKVVNAYRRIDPLRGEEYILDSYLSLAQNPKVREFHRIEVIKPFGPAQMLSDDINTNDEVIYFILPISRIGQRFHMFIKHYEKVCLQREEQVYLLIVLFEGTSTEDKEAAKTIVNLITSLQDNYPKAQMSITRTKAAFSRALGLDIGAKQLTPGSLLFFCDVDVVFSPDFLTRCRKNAVKDEVVYYPIVFSQANPDIVQKYSPKEKSKDLMDINKYTGHWVHYGFGMACMFNVDYRSVGGFNLDIKGWGGEDVDLYIKHVKSNLKVFRAADPALIHLYHSKACAKDLTPDQMRMCVDSTAETFGSRQQLGKLVARQASGIA